MTLFDLGHKGEAIEGCYWKLAALALRAMGYTNETRRARAASRESALAKRRLKLEEARANLRDLNDFFNASQRLAYVELWLDPKIAGLHAQAEARRATGLAAASKALAAMQGRGLTIEEIAQMAGMTAKEVTDHLQPAKVEEPNG